MRYDTERMSMVCNQGGHAACPEYTNPGGQASAALTARPAFAKPPVMRWSGIFLAVLMVCGLACGHARAMTPKDRLFYGVESLARGRVAQAAEALAAVVAEEPDNAYALTRLGLARAELGQDKAARQALDQALADKATNLFALWTLGCMDLLQGRLPQAEARFAAMEQADPGNARGALGQGLVAAMNGRRTVAVRCLAKAQAADSPDALTRYLTGLAYWLLGAPINARLELEAALERAPRFTPALELLGQVYRRQGKDGLARSAWEQALTVRADDARARFSLSRLAQDEGLAARLADRPKEARRAYGLALEIDHGNESAAKALMQLGPPTPAAGAKP